MKIQSLFTYFLCMVSLKGLVYIDLFIIFTYVGLFFFFMSHRDFIDHIAVTRTWLFVFMTQNGEFPSSFFARLFTLYLWSIMKLWTLLLHFFCLISQAPAYQRPIGHAHGFVSQRSQRLWLPWSESPSEWRPPFGKTLLFRTLPYFGGFDPSCAVLTADEMTSRWDEICVCYLIETCYR